jgi:hypothetical protein
MTPPESVRPERRTTIARPVRGAMADARMGYRAPRPARVEAWRLTAAETARYGTVARRQSTFGTRAIDSWRSACAIAQVFAKFRSRSEPIELVYGAIELNFDIVSSEQVGVGGLAPSLRMKTDQFILVFLKP